MELPLDRLRALPFVLLEESEVGGAFFFAMGEVSGARPAADITSAWGDA
jgi:hypothetical protein